jgi:oligoendopeptidase F
MFWDEKSAWGTGADRVPERAEQDPKFQWNVSAMYARDEDWNADFARLEELVTPLEAMRGTLNSPEAVARLFEAETTLERSADRLYVYAHLREDENTADSVSQGRHARIRAKMAEIGARLAWIEPEILAQPEATLREWTESEALRQHRHPMTKLLRRKPHTLSDKEERLLARASEILSAPYQTYGFLTNADMRFPDVVDANGRPRELSQGRFISFLQDRDRRVRCDAFHRLYETYAGFRNTLACTLSTAVKLNNYRAEVRQHPNALAAALHADHIPPALYEGLIAAVHEALPAFYDYMDLRRRALKLDALDMYDVYVPIVPDYDVKVPFEQAREMVLAACEPLGEEYGAALRGAFESGWMDVYENRGKRSGAYSSGCYDSLPYILLNYQGTLDDVFTLAHELGHSLHSWLANRNQPPRLAAYPIFIAEIASTLNEALLLRHLLATADNDALRAYLLNHLCDAFKGTVYRQTMFAEFEKRIHELDAGGQPLTAATLNTAYYELNAAYYGAVVKSDRAIEAEWSRIPHFYYNFYVYKYATSFCASQALYRRVLESPEGRDGYLGLLKAGGSGDPLDLVRAAGVDLLDPVTLSEAFATFRETVGQLAGLLKT